MPLPLLFIAGAAIKAVVAKAAAAKTIALATKGGAVIGKAMAGKGAMAARTLSTAAHIYGTKAVIAGAVFATVSVGAAALMYERAKSLRQKIQDGDISGAVSTASLLVSDIGGLGGLDDARQTLSSFVSSSGHSSVSETAALASGLIGALESKIRG